MLMDNYTQKASNIATLENEKHLKVSLFDEPHKRGYQITYNYEVRFWQAHLGMQAWSLYQLLRSYGLHSEDVSYTEYPTLNSLAGYLGLSDTRTLKGRVRGKGTAKERWQKGLLEILEEANLVILGKEGEGTQTQYSFAVSQSAPMLTEKQVATLPEYIQRAHKRFIDYSLQKHRRNTKGFRLGNAHSENSTDGTMSYRRMDNAPTSISSFNSFKKCMYAKSFASSENGKSKNQNPLNIKDEDQRIKDFDVRLFEALKEFGVDPDTAKQICFEFDNAYIEEKYAYAVFKKAKGHVKNPVGWLVSAIFKDFAKPKDFIHPEEMEKQEEERRLKNERMRESAVAHTEAYQQGMVSHTEETEGEVKKASAFTQPEPKPAEPQMTVNTVLDQVRSGLDADADNAFHAKWQRKEEEKKRQKEKDFTALCEKVELDFTPQDKPDDTAFSLGEYGTAWDATYNQLRLQLDIPTFDTWIRGVRFMGIKDGKWLFKTDNPYKTNMLQNRLYRNLKGVLSTMTGDKDVELFFMDSEADLDRLKKATTEA